MENDNWWKNISLESDDGEPKTKVNEEILAAVMGAGGVGKSTLARVFCGDTFIQEYTPTIEDSYKNRLLVNGHDVPMDILDEHCQEEYAGMIERWIRRPNAFMLVYSINDRASFEKTVESWEVIRQYKDPKSFCALLVGNKSDEDTRREVTWAEGSALAHKLSAKSRRKVPFVETSAKLKTNVALAFAEARTNSEEERAKRRVFAELINPTLAQSQDK